MSNPTPIKKTLEHHSAVNACVIIANTLKHKISVTRASPNNNNMIGDNVIAGYYINLDAREDRRTHMQQTQLPVFAGMGISVERLSATCMPKNGALGCAISHTRALAAGVATHRPWILVLEDDFQWELPHADIVAFFERWYADATHTTMPDVLCLTYYLPKTELVVSAGSDVATTTTTHYTRAHNMQTTCGYIVSREFAQAHLLPCFERAAAQLQAGATLHTSAIDVAWKPMQHQHYFAAATPRLARQLPGVSDILTSAVRTPLDYGGSFAVLVHCAAPHHQTTTHYALPFFTLHVHSALLADALRQVRAASPVLAYILVVSSSLSSSELSVSSQQVFDCLKQFVSPRHRPRSVACNTAAYGNRVFVVKATLLDAWLSTLGPPPGPPDDAVLPMLRRACAQARLVCDMGLSANLISRNVRHATAVATAADTSTASAAATAAATATVTATATATATAAATATAVVSDARVADGSASRSPQQPGPRRHTCRQSESPLHAPVPRVVLGPWSAAVAVSTTTTAAVEPAWVETLAE